MKDNDYPEILAKAFLHAGKMLGMTFAQLNKVLSSEVSQLSEIEPKSSEGIRALYFIRIYKKLYELVSGDEEEMKLWMKGDNKGTGGIPMQQIQEENIVGLKRVMDYLESLP